MEKYTSAEKDTSFEKKGGSKLGGTFKEEIKRTEIEDSPDKSILKLKITKLSK